MSDLISRQAVFDLMRECDEELSSICPKDIRELPPVEQKQESMTVEEYRQRMMDAFHNADCDELIALVVLPTEKEFEHLEWLLETHYKAKSEPCEDIKLNFVPLSVIEDIMAEIDEQCDCVKRDNIYCSEGLEIALEIIRKHIGGGEE